jgi:cyclophilin family peptidyl-prolyl cis-trans isomerase
MDRRRGRRGKLVTGVAMVASLGIAFLTVLSYTSRSSKSDLAANKKAPATTTTTSLEAPCPRADGQSARRDQFKLPPRLCINPTHSFRADVLTDVGTYSMELNARAAPQTVNNFVFLSRYHFYDAVPFNRVKPGFIVQGGNPPGEGITGPGYVFADENVPAPPAKYKVGNILMARDRPNSNGSQFIIIMGPEGENLPLLFSLFARVSGGMDVVRRIEADGSPDFAPKVIHTIQKVTIIESES